MYICPYCGEESTKKESHLRWCKSYLEYRNTVLNKEKIESMYFDMGMSANEIGNSFGFTANTVINAMKRLGIKTRSVKESASENRQKEIRKKTSLERYGFPHNFSRGCPSRVAWENRLIEEEGIVNVFQREDVKEKSKTTFIQKYGVESPGHLARGRKSSLTKPHLEVIKILQENSIEFGIEFKIDNPERQFYSYDIIIDKTYKLIEVYGDYWHGNPVLYKSTDLIMKGSSAEVKVGNKWLYDARKIRTAKNNGYKVLVVWEYDLNNYYDETKNKILDYVRNENENSEN